MTASGRVGSWDNFWFGDEHKGLKRWERIPFNEREVEERRRKKDLMNFDLWSTWIEEGQIVRARPVFTLEDNPPRCHGNQLFWWRQGGVSTPFYQILFVHYITLVYDEWPVSFNLIRSALDPVSFFVLPPLNAPLWHPHRSALEETGSSTEYSVCADSRCKYTLTTLNRIMETSAEVNNSQLSMIHYLILSNTNLNNVVEV